MASYFDKICDIATEWTWDQLFPLRLNKNVEKNNPQRQHDRDKAAGMKTPKGAFFWDTLFVPGCIFVLASP